jgi:DNA-binding transcriptional MerR regulator
VCPCPELEELLDDEELLLEELVRPDELELDELDEELDELDEELEELEDELDEDVVSAVQAPNALASSKIPVSCRAFFALWGSV